MNITSISFQCTLCNHDSNSQIRYVLISNLKLSQLIKEAFNTVTDTVNIFAPFSQQRLHIISNVSKMSQLMRLWYLTQ